MFCDQKELGSTKKYLYYLTCNAEIIYFSYDNLQIFEEYKAPFIS